MRVRRLVDRPQPFGDDLEPALSLPNPSTTWPVLANGRPVFLASASITPSAALALFASLTKSREVGL